MLNEVDMLHTMICGIYGLSKQFYRYGNTHRCVGILKVKKMEKEAKVTEFSSILLQKKAY